MEYEKHRHESFGQVQFSRVTGGANKFYGSELPQDHYITMEVKNSEKQVGLTSEHYYGYGSLIKVRMTSSQFAELIASLNTGGGVPCTIERLNGNKVADMPVSESRKELVHRKFKDRMTEFANKIREDKNKAKELVKKKTLSKQDISDLTRRLDWITMEIEQNIPFFAECFQETMDEVVLEAKSEVENAIQHKIQTLGLNSLHEQNKLLNQ